MRVEAYREGVKVWEVKGGLSEAVEEAVTHISEAPLPDELRVARRQLAEKLRETLLEKELPLPPIFIGRFKHTPPPLSDKLLSEGARRLLSEANGVRTRHGYMKLVFNDAERRGQRPPHQVRLHLYSTKLARSTHRWRKG